MWAAVDAANWQGVACVPSDQNAPSTTYLRRVILGYIDSAQRGREWIGVEIMFEALAKE